MITDIFMLFWWDTWGGGGSSCMYGDGKVKAQRKLYTQLIIHFSYRIHLRIYQTFLQFTWITILNNKLFLNLHTHSHTHHIEDCNELVPPQLDAGWDDLSDSMLLSFDEFKFHCSYWYPFGNNWIRIRATVELTNERHTERY